MLKKYMLVTSVHCLALTVQVVTRLCLVARWTYQWSVVLLFMFVVVIYTVHFAFSVLRLSAGYQEEHLTCKKWVRHDMTYSVLKVPLNPNQATYLFGVRCRWFAYGLADVTATPSFLALLKSRMVKAFWCWLTPAVLEKWPLNGCLYGTWWVYIVACTDAAVFPGQDMKWLE